MRENMEVSWAKLTNWIKWTRKRKDPGNKQEFVWPEGYHAHTTSEAGIKKGEWVWVMRSLHYRTHQRSDTTQSPNLIPSFSAFIFLNPSVASHIRDILLHFEMVWLVAIIIFSFSRIKTRAIVMDSGKMWSTEERDLLAKENESVKRKKEKKSAALAGEPAADSGAKRNPWAMTLCWVIHRRHLDDTEVLSFWLRWIKKLGTEEEAGPAELWTS